MSGWEAKIEQFVKVNERIITCALIVVALVLIGVAIFGKPHHKAMALIYIVL